MLICDLARKIDENIERTAHLAALVPAGQLHWKPPVPDAMAAGELLGHLLDCLAGFCAVLHKAYPEQTAALASLRALPVNHFCGIAEASDRILLYRCELERAFTLLSDADLDRKLPTVFVPEGESLLTLLLGNLEHLANHKYQLFLYLKLMGVKVSTADLYRFRGR